MTPVPCGNPSFPQKRAPFLTGTEKTHDLIVAMKLSLPFGLGIITYVAANLLLVLEANARLVTIAVSPLTV